MTQPRQPLGARDHRDIHGGIEDPQHAYYGSRRRPQPKPMNHTTAIDIFNLPGQPQPPARPPKSNRPVPVEASQPTSAPSDNNYQLDLTASDPTHWMAQISHFYTEGYTTCEIFVREAQYARMQELLDTMINNNQIGQGWAVLRMGRKPRTVNKPATPVAPAPARAPVAVAPTPPPAPPPATNPTAPAKVEKEDLDNQ